MQIFLLKTIEGDSQQEHLIHKKFSNIRCEGEWFKTTPKLLKFIENPYYLKSTHPSDKSRQTKWQKTKINQGLCSKCGKFPLSKKSQWLCDLCLSKARMYYWKAKQNKNE